MPWWPRPSGRLTRSWPAVRSVEPTGRDRSVELDIKMERPVAPDHGGSNPMHERTELEDELEEEAARIRAQIDGEPPVVVIVGGSEEGPGATATASVGLDRLRDLNGVLETAKYIENGKHFDPASDEQPRDDVQTDVE